MELLPQVFAPSERAPVNGQGTTPFAQQTVVLTKQASIELTWQATTGGRNTSRGWRGKPR